MYETLSSELSSLAKGMVSSEGFDADVVNDLMVRIQEAVPSMAKSDVVALLSQVDDTIALVSAKKSEVNDDLMGIRSSRKALGGYDHIKANDKEQRLYRRA